MPPPPRNTSHLTILLVAAAVLVGLGVLAVRARGQESVVLEWNAAMLDAVRAETTSPPLAARNLAILHLALFDAIECSQRLRPVGDAGIRGRVVMTLVGCATASALCPGRAGDFERHRDRALARLDAPPTAEEWSVAARCTTQALESRAGDGASRSVNYPPSAQPGQWRRTAPFFRPPELPHWAEVRPFAIADAAAYRVAGPPALESAAWQAALDELRRVGGRTSTERTADQALSARFWSDFSHTSTPPGHWNEIAAGIARERGIEEREIARLFARLNVALADAAIVCWRIKYAHNFWRPATALAAGGWQPLLNTPAHPEYPSGHGMFSGAAAEVLADFLGGDACEFTAGSDSVPGVERRFTSFSEAAREISLSRVYAGIHYRFSCEAGVELGRAVAREVLHRDPAPRSSSPQVASR